MRECQTNQLNIRLGVARHVSWCWVQGCQTCQLVLDHYYKFSNTWITLSWSRIKKLQAFSIHYRKIQFFNKFFFLQRNPQGQSWLAWFKSCKLQGCCTCPFLTNQGIPDLEPVRVNVPACYWLHACSRAGTHKALKPRYRRQPGEAWRLSYFSADKFLISRKIGYISEMTYFYIYLKRLPCKTKAKPKMK